MSGPVSHWESACPVRYPDPDIVVLDPRFQAIALGNAGIQRIATGFGFTEVLAYFDTIPAGQYILPKGASLPERSLAAK